MAPEMHEFIQDMIQRHQVMTLATIRADGFPDVTVVTYVSDGLTIYFAAAADSQKLRNIRACSKVSLTIQRQDEDWNRIAALTMAALADEIADASEARRVLLLLAAKFPDLGEAVPTLEQGGVVVVRLRPKTVALIDNARDIADVDVVELWQDTA